MPLCEAIESAYLKWKSEQHRPKPKYDSMCSLATLVKNDFLTTEENDNQLKITCQHYNCFVTCTVRSVEILYITCIHSRLPNIGLYPEEIDPENFFFVAFLKKNATYVSEVFERR